MGRYIMRRLWLSTFVALVVAAEAVDGVDCEAAKSAVQSACAAFGAESDACHSVRYYHTASCELGLSHSMRDVGESKDCGVSKTLATTVRLANQIYNKAKAVCGGSKLRGISKKVIGKAKKKAVKKALKKALVAKEKNPSVSLKKAVKKAKKTTLNSVKQMTAGTTKKTKKKIKKKLKAMKKAVKKAA